MPKAFNLLDFEELMAFPFLNLLFFKVLIQVIGEQQVVSNITTRGQ